MVSKDVSLLPRSFLQGTVFGKFFNWLLSAGRYIVIFVNLAVVSAFVSRFWLDKKRIDLSDQIRQRQAILESVSGFEQEFRLFQSRLNQAGNAIAAKEGVLAPLDLIIGSLPKDIIFLQYGFDSSRKEASVSTFVFSEASLNVFVDNLLAKSNVSSVKIGTIEREQGAVGMKVQFLVGFSNLEQK